MAKNKKLTKKTTKPVVDKNGSLGLIAAGYKGIMVWRNVELDRGEFNDEIVGPVISGKILNTRSKVNSKDDK